MSCWGFLTNLSVELTNLFGIRFVLWIVHDHFDLILPLQLVLTNMYSFPFFDAGFA